MLVTNMTFTKVNGTPVFKATEVTPKAKFDKCADVDSYRS